MVKRGEMEVPIIGVARSDWTLDKLRKRARESLEQSGGVDPGAFAKLSERLRYIQGDYQNADTYGRLAGCGKTSQFSDNDDSMIPVACRSEDCRYARIG